MLLYIIIVVVVVVVGVVLFLTMRNRLKVESVNFDNEIKDIASAFEKDFEKCYVSGSDERLFIDRFTPVFNDACSLKHKLETFRIAPSQKLEKLISDYEAIPSFVKKHNEAVLCCYYKSKGQNHSHV